MAYIGNSPEAFNLSVNKYTYTATANQTMFSCVYDNIVDVFMNGSKLQNNIDYVANNGVSMTLLTPASTGDIIDIDGYFNYQSFDLSTYKNNLTANNVTYSGSLTGGTGIINIGSGQIYKDVSGNIGIGITSPAARLHVHNASSTSNIRISGSNGGNAQLELYGDGQTAATYVYENSSGIFIIQKGAAERMRIDSNGNLGLGTTSPLTKLDIAAARTVVRLTSTTGTNSVYQNFSNTGGNFYIGLDNSAGSDFNSPYAGAVWHGGAYPILFATRNAERMRLDASGNLGIGTSTPSYRLDVAASSNTTPSRIQITDSDGRAVAMSNPSTTNDAWIGTPTNHSCVFRVGNSGGSSLYMGFNLYDVERMRLDSSGRLLINATSMNNWGSVLPKLRVDSVIQLGSYSLIGEDILDNDSLCLVSDATENICFGQFTPSTATYTERMRLDSNGRLGIGTSSPETIVDFGTMSSGNGIRLGQVDTGLGDTAKYIGLNDLGSSGSWAGGCWHAIKGNNAGDYWHTWQTQKYGGGNFTMTLDAVGNLLLNTTDVDAGIGAAATKTQFSFRAASEGFRITASGSSYYNTVNGAAISWRCNGTAIGYIVFTSSSTAYVTSSDYRLKDVVGPLSGLATILALKPVVFTWKVDGSLDRGFIAHELQEVIPQAVNGEKDAVNLDGSIKPQGVDYGRITPEIVAAIQEQQKIIEELKARIEKLENK